MIEWELKGGIDLEPCDDMVLYRGVEKLLNSLRKKEMGYSEVIDNIANYVRQKEKEIREDERWRCSEAECGSGTYIDDSEDGPC